MTKYVSQMLLALADVIKGFGGWVGFEKVTEYPRSMIAQDVRHGGEQREMQYHV